MFKKYKANGTFWLTLAFLIMLLLFLSSSQSYTEQSQISNIQHFASSKPFEKELSKFSFYYAGKVISIEKLGYAAFVEFLLRKFAHFSTYFLLAMALFLGLKKKTRLPFLLLGYLVGLATIGYGATDEMHQSFTAGRSPLFEDVMLDGMGGFTSILMFVLFEGIRKIKKRS